jgi:hypothetical protein
MRDVQKRAIELSVGWMSEADRTDLTRLLGAMNDHVRTALDTGDESEVRP